MYEFGNELCQSRRERTEQAFRLFWHCKRAKPIRRCGVYAVQVDLYEPIAADGRTGIPTTERSRPPSLHAYTHAGVLQAPPPHVIVCKQQDLLTFIGTQIVLDYRFIDVQEQDLKIGKSECDD